MKMAWLQLTFLILCIFHKCSAANDNKRLLVISVATNETDGYHRYIRSIKQNNLKYKILGLGEAWRGGDVQRTAGGGHKVNLLKEAMEEYQHQEDLVVLFTDSYDVIITGSEDELLARFDSFNAKVVFGAEDFCWPSEELSKEYPKVSYGYKYLNSGGFIGYAPEIFNIINRDIKDTDDDQLFYTKIFLSEELRNKYKIKLDTQAKIFQNLNGNAGDVSLKFEDDDTVLTNTVYQTQPLIIHGNGPSKILLNSIGNYVAKAWIKDKQCIICNENKIDFKELSEDDYPVILVGVFIEKPVPFLREMLEKVVNIIYPKHRLHLYVHSQVPHHNELVDEWVNDQREAGYSSVNYIPSSENLKEWHARNKFIDESTLLDVDAVFNVDAEVHLDNPETLKLLLSYNKPFIGAIINRPGKAWSTFWGAVTDEGFYARSSDYMEIVNNERRGVWNVPYITGAYVIRKSLILNPETKPSYIHKLLDADMALTANFRDKSIFMYASNMETYGHLINPDYYNTKHLHDEMWQMVANSKDWEERYLHPFYYKALQPDYPNDVPCPDVFWFPLFTPEFCEHLIEISEDNGQWSTGKNEDPRLAGGYENVPTVDIHMNQIEYEQEWLWILKNYIKPLAEKVYLGYTSEAKAIMNFIVRYKPTEQSFLRPHHDSSTYTINIGLNKPFIDYEGGGAHFIRYNCSVINTKVGWGLMHPGRLTHYHEGLQTTKGTRYIMISFIDP